ncbi:DUF4890 domain-containing protein [Flavobacterium agrisoli]|uniref:DUF4890 domain-containing protein n=1 Tax=Flavobacterium agrisoli TaxID=2793066 RepID=A0A934UKD5_9FLAO|nr:DUF4890 domain-containing protein [Flavobacterium agrisoli]MBK0370443.1 DUF4890 domain-containing protein [Flavobacterium agrisoli]
MKKFLLVALLSIGMVGFAQNRPERERLTPEQRVEKQTERLTKELNLSSDQQKQVKDLLTSESAEMQKMRGERSDRASKPTAAEREVMKKQMTAAKEGHNAKMKTILTDDQYKKFVTNQEKSQERMRENVERRRSNSDGGDNTGMED